ncbi:MAG: aromatic ring-hydroxylating dioxygenase subunit alpha [Pseudomonadota bacterium]
MIKPTIHGHAGRPLMPAIAELDPELRTNIEKTRAGLYDARHLPGFYYTSQEIFEREIDTIFMREWLCVGRLEEFEKPGDYAAMRIAGEPLLVCRGADGELRAFRNLCQHRGVEVAVGEGNAKRFTCRYHAWTYATDGRLSGAPHNQEVANFDFKSCRLPQVNIDTWGGYIFINFDPNCRPLADCLDEDGVRDFAAFLQPENTRTSDKFVFEVPCNWKFVPENLMDMYHVGVIHKASFGAHFPVEDFRFNLTGNGYNAVYEALTMAPNGVTLFGAMPWLEGKVSDKLGCTTWVRPTMNIFGRHDLIQPWVALPIDVNRTQVTIYTQLPEQFFETPGFAEKNQIYADFIRLVATEDEAMLESLQTGVNSRGFTPGPTVKLERAIHHLLNYYLDSLLDDDASARERRLSEGRQFLKESVEKHPNPIDAGYSKSFGCAHAS